MRLLSRRRGSMYVEYLILVGAVALVSVAMVVRYEGKLRDQFRREISAVAKKGKSK